MRIKSVYIPSYKEMGLKQGEIATEDLFVNAALRHFGIDVSKKLSPKQLSRKITIEDVERHAYSAVNSNRFATRAGTTDAEMAKDLAGITAEEMQDFYKNMPAAKGKTFNLNTSFVTGKADVQKYYDMRFNPSFHVIDHDVTKPSVTTQTKSIAKQMTGLSFF